MTGIVSGCAVPVAVLIGAFVLLCGGPTCHFVTATFDLDDDLLDGAPTITPNLLNAAAKPAVCATPPTADQQKSKDAVCGVIVPRPDALRQFLNAGELLRFNCQNPVRPFLLVAKTTCATYLTTGATAVGAQVQLI